MYALPRMCSDVYIRQKRRPSLLYPRMRSSILASTLASGPKKATHRQREARTNKKEWPQCFGRLNPCGVAQHDRVCRLLTTVLNHARLLLDPCITITKLPSIYPNKIHFICADCFPRPARPLLLELSSIHLTSKNSVFPGHAHFPFRGLSALIAARGQ